MIINLDLDPNIKSRKLEELYDAPVTIKVNKFDEPSVAQFIMDMQRAEINKQSIIPIMIDSYGGQVYSLLAMIDIIKRARKPVATIVSGKAMSCGAILFSCGTEGFRFMGERATIMIHDVSTGSHGKVEEVKADAGEAERLNKTIYKIMAENTGHKKDFFFKEVHDRGRADWYITAEEAKKLNLTNHIRIPEFDVKISLDVKFK